MRARRVGTSLRGSTRTATRLGALLFWLCTSACGRVGIDLLPLALTDAGDPAAVDGASAQPGLTSMCTASACTLAGCPGDPNKTNPGVCGCGHVDNADADGDSTPDCVDFCSGTPDRLADGSCGCAASQADSDGDGAPNCTELCPYDPRKQSPGTCGCGASDDDSDGDGSADCVDECLHDPNKTGAGTCGCGVSEQDTDLDGLPDCVDTCSGMASQSYTPNAACGAGYCRAHNVASSCLAGVETACKPGAALASTDSTCDGIDDDCDGSLDEDFGAASSCGRGACAMTGVLSCSAGKVSDTCVAGLPLSSTDTTCNNIDDDCDGKVDEEFVVRSSTCAVGACGASGTIACVNGQMVDSCTPSVAVSASDASCDNIDENCNGTVDEGFVSTSSKCGVGVCARSGTVSCLRGSTVDSCTAGSPTLTRDTTCNNLDEDCDGKLDDDYAGATTSCGLGACLASGTVLCTAGTTRDSCAAKAPTTTIDDAFVPGNGIDDDCDGSIDEDVPPCDTTPRTFEAGAYASVVVPGNCHSLSAKLWGGGGAGGQNVGIASTPGGVGGPGGYATVTALVKGTINLFVGNGASSGCNNGGTNAGAAAYNGGTGGTGAGGVGADGVASGGGTGGQPANGHPGGDGHYGGGGGGQGSGGLGTSGTGGGGGAATILLVNAQQAAAAGGGGGGGGAQESLPLGLLASRGGAGGSGCKGNGAVQTTTGGGGGGGGLCQGSATQTGSGATPAASASIPSGRAKGGNSNCGAGGAGYAILTFGP